MRQRFVSTSVRTVGVLGLDIEAWGYNGGTPGPLIEAVVGDRVRIYVTNKLPEPTSVLMPRSLTLWATTSASST